MLMRTIWTLLVFVVIGPGLGGAFLIVILNVLDLLSGRGLVPVSSMVTMLPYFWSFAWAQAVLIGLAMLLVWHLLPARRPRLLASVPVGALCMLVATPLLYGRSLLEFASEPFGAILAVAAGLATLPSQMIVEAIVTRVSQET